MALIEVQHLKKYFDVPNGTLHAVDDVSFKIEKGTASSLQLSQQRPDVENPHLERP